MTTSITCPVCSNLCSSQAASCPRCGHPFVAQRASKNNQQTNIWKILTIVTGIVFISILGYSFYTYFVNRKPTPTSQIASQNTTSTNKPVNSSLTTPTKGTLEIQSAIDYKIGGVQPVANTPFYVLDKSVDDILNDANIVPHSAEFREMLKAGKRSGKSLETLPPTYWVKLAFISPEMFGDFLPLSLAEIRKHTVKATNTDLQGKAIFEGLENKQYYIFGVTETRGGSSIWNLPINIKEGKQSIILDQNNAYSAS